MTGWQADSVGAVPDIGIGHGAMLLNERSAPM